MLTDVQGGHIASASDISPPYPSQKSISLPAGNTRYTGSLVESEWNVPEWAAVTEPEGLQLQATCCSCSRLTPAWVNVEGPPRLSCSFHLYSAFSHQVWPLTWCFNKTSAGKSNITSGKFHLDSSDWDRFLIKSRKLKKRNLTLEVIPPLKQWKKLRWI